MDPPIPSHFKVGKAIGGGDCFFDSVAQGLKQLRPKSKHDVRSLRQKCAQFVKDHQNKDAWISKALEHENQNVNQYAKEVQYCAEDFNQGMNPMEMKGPMWGRPEIEGRIICNIFNVTLHVIEKHTIENNVLWIDEIVDKNGSKSVNNIDYESNSMINIVNKGAEHFEPLLGANAEKRSRVVKRVKRDDPVSRVKEDLVQKIQVSAKELTPNLQQDSCNSSEYQKQSCANQSLSYPDSKSVPGVDYDVENQIHVINEGDLHFKPILKEYNELNPPEYPLKYDPENLHSSLPAQNIKSIMEPVENPTTVSIHSEMAQSRSDVKPNPEKYVSTQGAAGGKGQLYEVKLLMLFFLRGLTQTEKFVLAKNAKVAGKFDDVIFKYKKFWNEKWKTIFMQLKHKDNIENDRINVDKLLSKRGDLSLHKYFGSYTETRKQFMSKNNKKLFPGDFHDCDFIIYTNNLLDPQLDNDPDIIKTNWDDFVASKILSTSGTSKAQTLQLKNMKYIANNLSSAAQLKQLARVIYDYTFGTKSEDTVSEQIDIFTHYQYPLTNEVFEIKAGEPNTLKVYGFKNSFVNSTGSKEAKCLWDEMFAIVKHKLLITKDTFQENLKAKTVRLFQTFGDFTLKSKMTALAKKLGEIIKESKQKTKIEIDDVTPLRGINGLANNVLICDSTIDDSKQWVKFKTENLVGYEKQFIAKLKKSITIPDFDLSACRLCIRGFPKFSLPKPGSKLKNDDVDEFLKSFHIFAGQSNESELDSIIKHEIRVAYGENEDNSRTIFLNVKDLVQEWWKEKQDYLTDNDQCCLDEQFRIQLNEMGIKKINIQFDNGKVEELANLIRNHNILNIVSEKGAKLLSLKRIIQVLNGIREWLKENFRWIFIKLDQLMNTKAHILKAFDTKHLLVIDVTWREQFTALRELRDIMLRNNNIRVILSTECELTNIFEEHLKIYVHVVHDKSTFKDLTAQSQQMVLMKEVIFQGKTTKLNKLINITDNSAKNVISSQTLMQLINNEELNICNVPVRLSDMDAAYAKMHTEIPVDNLVEVLTKSVGGTCLYFICGICKPRNGTVEDELFNLLNIADDSASASVLMESMKMKRIELFAIEHRDKMLDRFQKLCVQETRIVYFLEAIAGHFYLQQIYDPNYYMNRILDYPQKVRLRDAMLWQYMSDTVILQCECTTIRAMKMIKAYIKEYDDLFLKRFLMQIHNKQIIIARTEKEAETKFRKLFSKGINAHWLTSDVHYDGDFTWLRSNGTLDELRKYVIMENVAFDEETFIQNVKSKCVVVADEPGMGKTTTLTSLSEKMLATNWVIRIDFRECGEAIATLKPNYEPCINFEVISDFFSRISSAGMQSDLAKKLFVYKIQQTTSECNTIIIFDAFDEINDDQQQKVTPLIRFLKDESSARLWITTRRTRMIELENCLSTFATQFQILSQTQQEDFLFKVWQVRFNFFKKQNFDDKLKTYIEKLLTKSMKYLGKEIISYMGVPLQLRILTDVFQNDALHYCQAESNLDPQFEGLNISGMYERFIREKYNIYFREKSRLDDHPQYVKNILSKAFSKDHQRLAFKELFPEEMELSYELKLPSKEDENDLKLLGIIQSFGSEGNIYFIHRTFAEYFVADLLASDLQNIGNKRQSTEKFIMKEIFEDRNIVIRRFLDQMLSRNSPTHMAALENDIAKLVEMRIKGSDIEVDKLGRTALHLACQEGHLNIVKVLLDNGYDALRADAFGKNTLHYATMNRHADIIKYLTNYTADINIYDHVFRTELTVKRIRANSIFQQREHLSSNLVKFVNHQDINGNSSLDYATKKQDWDNACTLILNGADICDLSAYIANQIYQYTLEYFDPSSPPIENRFLPITELLLITTPDFLIGQGRSTHTAIMQYLKKHGHKSVYNAVFNSMSESSKLQIPECLESDSLPLQSRDTTNSDTQIDLHSAAKNCDLHELKRISNIGVDVDIVDNNGKTALDYALLDNLIYDTADIQTRINTVKYLLVKCKAKCSLNKQDLFLANEILQSCDPSLLHNAATMSTTLFARYLIEAGADVNMKDKDGRTPLHYAALDSLNSSNIQSKLNMAVLLLWKGAMYDSSDNNNKTLLEHHTDNRVDSEILKLLIHIDKCFKDVGRVITDMRNLPYEMRTALVYARNINEDTLLNLAVMGNAADVVELLLSNYYIVENEVVNLKNKQGNTPLHLAAEKGCIHIVTLLIHCPGTIFNFANIESYTPQQIAEKNGYDGIAESLRKIDNVFSSIATNNTRVLQNAVQNQNGFYHRDRDGKTLQHWVAQYGRIDMAKLLLPYSNYIPLSINRPDFNGCTPLHYAAVNGHSEMVYFLLKNGALHNLLNKEGKTPMQLADKNTSDFLQSVHNTFKYIMMCRRHKAMADLKQIEQSNAEGFIALINSRDDEGNTLLHLSARANSYKLVKYLLVRGAPYDAVNRYRQTPQDLTTNPRCKMLFQFILKMFNIGIDTIDGINEEKMYQEFIHVRNDHGETVLHCSAGKLHITADYYYSKKRIVEYGANINAIDKAGNTVFDNAAVRRDLHLVKFLLVKGVDVSNIEEARLKRLKEYAEKEGRPDIVSLIQSARNESAEM